MKRYVLSLLFIFISFDSFSAQQNLAVKGGGSTLSINDNFVKQQSMNTELYANKADKTTVIRYWTDWPNASPGNTLAVDTVVAYGGDLYKCTQEFVKTSGATPVGFSTYFTKITGNEGESYTLPTASDETKGGIKVGDRLSISAEGVLSADVQSGTGEETDPVFGAWNKDYADLTNKPTIPTVSDAGYDATSWNENTDAPTKNAVRDKIEALVLDGGGGGVWGSITGTLSAQTDLQSALDLKANTSSLGTSSVLNVGTSPGNVVQLGGACTVGDGAYTDQSACETNSGQWVGVLSIICDSDTEDCNTKLDLISAYEVDQRVAAVSGISHATSDGNYHASKDGAWASLYHVYQSYDANMISWPSAISAIEVGYLDGLTEALSTTLSDKTDAIFPGATIELNTTTVANAGVIASGSSQLLSTAITATGVLAASDGVDWYFVGDPVAKTGFVPGTSGMLTLWPYVSADGYIQVRISNNTADSITLNTAGNGATIKLAVRR